MFYVASEEGREVKVEFGGPVQVSLVQTDFIFTSARLLLLRLSFRVIASVNGTFNSLPSYIWTVMFFSPGGLGDRGRPWATVGDRGSTVGDRARPRSHKDVSTQEPFLWKDLWLWQFSLQWTISTG